MAINRIQYWHIHRNAKLAPDLFILSRQVAFVLSTRARQQRSGQAAHEQKAAAQQRLFINIHHGGSSQPAVPAVLGDVGDRRLPWHPAIFHNILKNPGSLHPSPSQFAHVCPIARGFRRLWIHGGGVISEEGFNDLWTFDVPRLQWSQVASGSGPSRCWGHVTAWDGTLAGLDEEGEKPLLSSWLSLLR